MLSQRVRSVAGLSVVLLTALVATATSPSDEDCLLQTQPAASAPISLPLGSPVTVVLRLSASGNEAARVSATRPTFSALGRPRYRASAYAPSSTVRVSFDDGRGGDPLEAERQIAVNRDDVGEQLDIGDVFNPFAACESNAPCAVELVATLLRVDSSDPQDELDLVLEWLAYGSAPALAGCPAGAVIAAAWEQIPP